MINIKDVCKIYHNSDGDLLALNGVSFDVLPGEFVTIFGPNGSGKSTLFNIIAGLDNQTSGEIILSGKDIRDANIGFVFQNYNESMFPWLSVLDNVLFPLDVQKVSRKESFIRGENILKKVGLWEHKNKYLYQLSGGMRQLVAISRAFVNDPDFLLMDEPCSSLDYATTKKIEMELLSLWQEKRITTILVSHDIDEAVFLADRVVVLSPRPGVVREVIPVDLPRPRDLSMFSSAKFFEIRSRVLNAFSYE
jgi:NitT/TauT family transport system ATP-binding protein